MNSNYVFKGYKAIIKYDEEAMIFHGEVTGLKDVITFQAVKEEEIQGEFETSIDGYLNWCKELKQIPQKP